MNLIFLNTGFIVLFALSISGCYSVPQLTDDREDLNVKKVALFPFRNESGTIGAGKIVTNTFLVVLFKNATFKMEEKGNIERFLARSKVRDTKKISLKQLNLLGESLGIDAVLTGTVAEFLGGGKRAGSMTPVVSIRARLTDVRTGKILWMARHRKTGNDYITIFDFGAVRSVNALARRVISEMIKTIR